MPSSFITLLKLLIKTRYTLPALLFFFAILSLNLFSSFQRHNTELPFILKLYLFTILTFITVISFLFGGLLLLKSDADYLLTLPVPKKNLVLSLYTIQFIAYAFPVIYTVGAFLSLNEIHVIVAMALLVFLIVSLSTISFSLSNKQKIPIALFITIWMMTAMINFQYSPLYVFINDSIPSLIILACLTLITTFLAIRTLYNTELELAKRTSSITSSEVKKLTSFKNQLGKKAIRKLYLINFNFSARMNLMGISKYTTVRVNLNLLTIGVAIFSVAYAILLLRYVSFGGEITKVIVPIFLHIYSMAFAFFISSGLLANERVWLAFTSLDPAEYLREVFISRYLALLIMFSPLILVSIFLYFNGISFAINSVFWLLFFVPSFSIITSLVISYLKPVQIREEIFTAYQFSLKDLVVVLFIILGTILASISFITIATMISSIIFLLVFIYLILNKEILRELAYKMTESGFV
jgi:hypothetical protein